MERKFKLALIVAFYLSKYDLKAAHDLGYKSRRQAFRGVGEKINVNQYTIKHMRDQFDTVLSHRAGYHQSPLPPSRAEVVEKYSFLSEMALFEIVKDILNFSMENHENIESYVKVLEEVEEKDNKNKKKAKVSTEYTTRGITGIKAEELFLTEFKEGKINGFSDGALIDTRQDGTGYDFKLPGDPDIYFEVKGLASEKGGLLFTDKEWAVAKEKQEEYILVFITNISEEPNIQIIRNPYMKLKPNKNIYTTITVNWAVDASQLKS
ncbi:DUF3883 domain-containing protein [Peribacillus simplex]|uniref:DUF3883 domain-containing protein n=1 Tax=Peribacillus simplex TaxID=1478 RepID=UPI0024C00924|nr:DUF3883 domain-containing protein [Peribacillus simplex]WHY96631.1 DUF3883 domain-containing protein [Peribacillus simplex]